MKEHIRQMFLFGGIIAVLAIAIVSGRKWIQNKNHIKISYSEALALLKNADVEEVLLQTDQVGSDIKIRLNDGKLFSSFTTDKYIHEKIFEDKKIKLFEERKKQRISIGQILFFLALALVMSIGMAYVDMQRKVKQETEQLRRGF